MLSVDLKSNCRAGEDECQARLENTPPKILCLARIGVPTGSGGLEDVDERGVLRIRDSSGNSLNCNIFLKAKFGGTAKGQIEDAGKSKGIEIAIEGRGGSGRVRCRDQSRVTGEES